MGDDFCQTLEANGSQGRILFWTPGFMQQKSKALSATHPGLSCRFVKEASYTAKKELMSDVDFLDVTVRQETMQNVPGAPVQVQLGVVPCYAWNLARGRVAAWGITDTRTCTDT